MLNDSALETKDRVDNELSSLLDDIKNRLDLIRNKIQNVSGDLFDVAKNFPEFEEMEDLMGKLYYHLTRVLLLQGIFT